MQNSNGSNIYDHILNDVFVEIKFEPDYPGVSKPVVSKSEVIADLKKVEAYAEEGNAYLLNSAD